MEDWSSILHRSARDAFGLILPLEDSAPRSGRGDQLGLEPAAQLSLSDVGAGRLGQALLVILEQGLADIGELLMSSVVMTRLPVLATRFPEPGADDLKLNRLDELVVAHQVFHQGLGRPGSKRDGAALLLRVTSKGPVTAFRAAGSRSRSSRNRI